jgi:predicted nucleic acid-binding protein
VTASAVLDSSFFIAWGLEEKQFETGRNILTMLAHQGCIAPAHWATEVMEGLRKAVTRERISEERAFKLGQVFQSFGVEQDPETWTRAWRATLSLSRKHMLSVYDAAYLELALRKGLPLASLDGKLRAAAIQNQVLVLPRTASGQV